MSAKDRSVGDEEEEVGEAEQKEGEEEEETAELEKRVEGEKARGWKAGKLGCKRSSMYKLEIKKRNKANLLPLS